MMDSIAATKKLHDGSQIPQHGFGCYQIAADAMRTVLLWAMEAGYRYFDTATRYENEKAVGDAIRFLPIAREELYVVSKIWPTHYNTPEKAIEYSLKQLDLSYIDSYYLHWPGMDKTLRYKAWEAILSYQEKGLIQSVGVSNFTQMHLEDLIQKFGVTPVVNQIELLPWYQQTSLVQWCRSHHIEVTAWGPIFRGNINKEPALAAIGRRYGKSDVQVTLRWHLQKGHVVIPKATKKEHIFSNTDIYDFCLTEEEMAQITCMENGIHFGPDPMTMDGSGFELCIE